MESANSDALTTSPNPLTPEERLSHIFGSYKAEWLREQIFDFFTEPDYLPELTTARPCVLIGGRGTGKTTVLRGLSYEGQFAIRGKRPSDIPTWRFFGLYYRVNTNRVTALRGPELQEHDWKKLFAHYFNLITCDLVLKFLKWYRLHTDKDIAISSSACIRVAETLHVNRADDVWGLADIVKVALAQFEAYINNVVDAQRPPLSLQGAPLDTLIEVLAELPSFQDKQFFLLIDEYENFEDYQQQVINTLIKHASSLYTFKIGVRELGWRRRTTLNDNEQLISPADYVRVYITEKLDEDTFASFASKVCNGRLRHLSTTGENPVADISTLLPGLTEDREAALLGVAEVVAELKRELKTGNNFDEVAFDALPPLQAYMIHYWAEGRTESAESVYQDFQTRPAQWETRYLNYKHALLYNIRRGKRGIRKFYCGWDVFVRLAAGNIRYLLELVDTCLLLHIKRGHSVIDAVDFDVQTEAAQNVGRKNLSELEGISVHGAQLTKLVLGLGRVFQILAVDSAGHAPELTEFHLSEGTSVGDPLAPLAERSAALKLLDSAVMHLALIRLIGNKPTDEAETKDYDYMVHPIFSAFFVFSYRKKRKLMLSEEQILGLIRRPKETIKEILALHHRESDEPLPQQALLFEAFYRGSSAER